MLLVGQKCFGLTKIILMWNSATTVQYHITNIILIVTLKCLLTLYVILRHCLSRMAVLTWLFLTRHT